MARKNAKKAQDVVETPVEIVETPATDETPETLTPADEIALTVMEATEDEEQVEALFTSPASTEGSDQQSFKDMLAAVTDEDADRLVMAVVTEIDTRSAHEEAKNPDNANIHRTLKKVRKALASRRAGKVMAALGISPGFINRSVQGEDRYNVYALGKLGDLIDTLAGVQTLEGGNAINRCVVRNMFRCFDAGKGWSIEHAKMSASRRYAAKEGVEVERSLMVDRHTVDPKGTAPTQASSTMQALCTLGVVRALGGKNKTYEPVNGPIFDHFKALAA